MDLFDINPGLTNIPPTNGSAWILFFLSFFWIFLFSEYRRNTKILLAYWVVVGLHQIVALLFSFGRVINAVFSDGITFHVAAVNYAQNYSASLTSYPVDSAFFLNFLAIPYKLFGISNLLGCQISICAFSWSCILFLKFLDLFEAAENNSILLLFYGSTFSMIVYSSIPMREIFQILSLMLAIYSFIFFHRTKNLSFCCLGFLFALLFGKFHHGMRGIIIFLIFIMFFFNPDSTNTHSPSKYSFIRWIFITLLFILIIKVAFIPAMPFFSIDYLNKAREGVAFHGRFSRARYEAYIDPSSVFSIFLSIGNIIFLYLFSPLPWEVFQLKDLYGCVESLFRLILFTGIFCSIHDSKTKLRIWLFSIYLVLASVWAMGTGNFGTAMRHHLIHNWILIILGGPWLVNRIRRINFLFSIRGKS